MGGILNSNDVDIWYYRVLWLFVATATTNVEMAIIVFVNSESILQKELC